MTPGSAYRDFWAGVGERFPDLGGAVSTRYYSANERRLFTEHFPALDGLRILKTDLWDEAKNTRILAWASRQGARAYGIDISEPTVMQARAAFDNGPGARDGLRGAVGDVRALPFRDASFDAIVCVAAFKNFADPVGALDEMFRVLRPGGTASIHDLRKDAPPPDVEAEVARMQLSPLNAFFTRLTFRHLLLMRAYTLDAVARMAAASRFGRGEVALSGIGYELRLVR